MQTLPAKENIYMPNVTSIPTQVNNIPSVYNIPAPSGHIRRQYKGERDRFQTAQRLCDEKSASPGIRLLLNELIKSSNSLCEVVTGQASFARKLSRSLSTVKRYFKTIIDWGWIKSERRGNSWADKETNLITLLFLQHESPPVSVKMNHDINNLNNLKDYTNKQTYDEFVSLSANTDSKPQVKAQGKRISERAYKADPEGEIIRVCLAWALCEKKIKYAVFKMRDPKIKSPTSYLARLCQQLSKDDWDMSQMTKLEDEARKDAERRAKEQLERDLREERHQRIAQEAEVYKATGGDKKHMAEMREILRLAALRG